MKSSFFPPLFVLMVFQLLTLVQPEGAGEGAGAGVGGGQVGVGGQLGPRMFCLIFLWFCLHFFPCFPLAHFGFLTFFNFPDLASFFLLVLFFAFLFFFAF